MAFTYANLHRFGDAIGLYLGTGETCYLTPTEALAIASALQAAALDVRARPFVDSVTPSQSFELLNSTPRRWIEGRAERAPARGARKALQ